MSLRRFALAALASALVSGPVAAATQLLNVSYDPTRELYQAYNAAFIKHWKAQTGERIDTKALRKDHPEIAALYSTESTTRVLRLKSKKD